MEKPEEENTELLKEAVKVYQIDYLISQCELVSDILQPVVRIGNTRLYKVTH